MFFAGDPEQRYLLLIQPFGWILVAVSLAVMIDREWFGRLPDLRVALRSGAAILAAVLAIHLASGMMTLRSWGPPSLGDPRAALNSVRTEREPGEPVLVGSAPVGYLTLGGAESLYFLAGDEQSDRTQRYTRLDAEGQLVDYWVGMPAIGSALQLCEALESHPDAWIVVDQLRLDRRSVYGEMARVFFGSVDILSEVDQTVVMRPKPREAWTALAERTCNPQVLPDTEEGLLEPGALGSSSNRLVPVRNADDQTLAGARPGPGVEARSTSRLESERNRERQTDPSGRSREPLPLAPLPNQRVSVSGVAGRAEVSLLPRLVEEEEQTEQAVRRLKPERKTDSGDSRVKGDRATDDR
jgi:hypothetical protein